MMTLPAPLSNFMKGHKLDGLKPFALLYRNKWDSVDNKYTLEQTPIDISDLIAKPNTLSMTLDVNEVAQYNANNVTLTLSDTKNYFVEGTPNSYFPEGYQIYGSRVVLYYGTDGVNRTPLFTGVIKDLPTHKPENYQVDVKLVSPLEMLKDIEAKDFSDKIIGETLTYLEDDDDGHKVYKTTGTGVGGFNGVYANGVKIYEGVDYEVDNLNALGLPSKITIINSDYYSSTITADYYTWKTGLTVEQIVAGLVGLAGYDSGNEDIRNVVWNTAVRTRVQANPIAALSYYQDGSTCKYYHNFQGFTDYRGVILTTDFKIDFGISDFVWRYALGDVIEELNVVPQNGISIFCNQENLGGVYICRYVNGQMTDRQQVSAVWNETFNVNVERYSNTLYIRITSTSANFSTTYTTSETLAREAIGYRRDYGRLHYYILEAFRNGLSLGIIDTDGQILFDVMGNGIDTTLAEFGATLSTAGQNTAYYRTGENNYQFSAWRSTSLGANIGETCKYYQVRLDVVTGDIDVADPYVDVLSSELVLQLVNLSGSNVLEALQDFALISGYEFGVDRQGVFFFRPRVASATPTYILDHDEIVKVDTVKKNLSDFFTKLTLTFAQVPLEFYANTGERPTPIDKYGVINKEIDKPDIVNYDNPELAQAIGPQLLEVYSALPNVIQVTGKLNLSLELGDIVSLRRNMNLITPEGYTDYSKYEDLNTYYRACKITGMNYNFSKKQITYTLRDVSNKNTEPMYELEQFVYELPIKLGVKK